MSLITNIVISIVVAALATAATSWYAENTHGAILLFASYACATLATALLISLISRGKDAQSADGPEISQHSDGELRESGQVKWFNVSKGYGFITKDDGQEIFVHFRSIKGGGRRGLRDGQRVSFVVRESEKGPQAEDVETVS